jgi:23S rRNA (uracil-5-)-methyltransferase RumA
MTEPTCPYFGKCGGCSSQHIPYEIQLENKKKQMASCARFDDIKVFSGSEYGYRNRMDFIFHPGGLGFREKEKWFRIIDIDACPISEPRINEILKEIRQFFQGADVFDVKKKSGTFRYAVVRTSQGASSISFILNDDSSRLSNAVEKIKEFAEKSTAENIAVAYVPSETDVSISSEYFVVKGTDVLEEQYLGRSFGYSIQGFFQNNHMMAEKLQAYVHNILKKYDTRESHLLDLYAGVGTFGIVNAELFEGVSIVEGVGECIDSANLNIEKNSIQNAKAFLLDARMLKKIELPKDLFVITDPPRSGMHPDTILEIIKRKPKVIIYISCNIQQLSKDLLKFSDYEVRSAAVFDLFPQTPHCEGVVELARKEVGG